MDKNKQSILDSCKQPDPEMDQLRDNDDSESCNNI